MCGVAEGLEDGSMRTLKAVRSVNKLVSRDPIAALQPRSEVNLDYCHGEFHSSGFHLWILIFQITRTLKPFFESELRCLPSL